MPGTLPSVGGSRDTWGTILNTELQRLDAVDTTESAARVAGDATNAASLVNTQYRTFLYGGIL